jgi:hypothetical protein
MRLLFFRSNNSCRTKKTESRKDSEEVPKNDKDMYGLRYAEFVVPLVKAVQEQQKMIEKQQQLMQAQQQTIQQLEKRIEALEKR